MNPEQAHAQTLKARADLSAQGFGYTHILIEYRFELWRMEREYRYIDLRTGEAIRPEQMKQRKEQP